MVDWLTENQKWIFSNIQWIFSGIGVLIISLFLTKFFKEKKSETRINLSFPHHKDNPEKPKHLALIKPKLKARRVDAAAPDNAKIGEQVDLVIQVRFPESPLLGTEDWPTKQKPTSIEQTSDTINLEFPIDQKTGNLNSTYLKIIIVTSDFEIQGQSNKHIEIPPDQYSKKVMFYLKTLKTGSCRINVEVYSLEKEIYLGLIPFETTVSKTKKLSTSRIGQLFLNVKVADEYFFEIDNVQHSQVAVIGDNTTITGDVVFQTPSQGTDATKLRAAYLNRILVSTGILSLSGIDLDPKASQNKNEKLNLGAIYTALLTQSSKNDDMHKQDNKRISALEMLNREKHLVLLGDPGIGKSTFVNFVAWCLAGESLTSELANIELLIQPLPDDEGEDEEEKQKWSHGAILPVRIILRDFIARAAPDAKETGRAKHLWAFIEQELTDASLGDYSKYLEQELKENGGLILLDGLDEVPVADDRRVQLKEIIEDFKATFDKCRILVTSRTYAYEKQDFQISGMKSAVLAVFRPKSSVATI